MDDNKVPYTVYEAAQARSDRRFKLMWILIIIMFLSFVCTNVGWIIYESQFQDEVTETYDATTDSGGTAIANGNGEITVNGEGKVHKDN